MDYESLILDRQERTENFEDYTCNGDCASCDYWIECAEFSEDDIIEIYNSNLKGVQ